MRCLVTGGCGFIGSHLVNALIEKGHEVVVIDNLTSGKKERLNSKARFILGDIRNPDDVKQAMENCKIVFHLAALTDLRTVTEEMDKEVNFEGSKNVFSAAQEIGARIVFTSSAAVYGNSSAVENGECKPLSYYGKNKLETERLCPENSFVVRLFNVYGPYGKSFVNTLCKKIPDEEEIVVYGDGSNTRDYIYVDDVVSALLLSIGQNGIYNVGTGIETTVLDLIGSVEKIANKKARIKFEKENENEIKNSRADITRINKLGWEAKISLEEGVRRLME
jgi:UDP-glucose 4-epimerase